MKLRFGPFLLDSDARELLFNGTPRKLTPKALALLELLIAQRPRAVSKQEILERLWPGTFVSESNVPTLVNEVRGALDDDGRRPRYLRTVHRFGYAFCGVAASQGGDPAAPVLYLVRDQQRFELRAGENVLGRGGDAAVVVDHSSVSRRHAVIHVRADEAVIEDCGSKNGTFVGGRRLDEPLALHDSDVILLGAVRFVFRAALDDSETTTAWPSVP
jgi:DNA-binding winged helix-turn-helix (wHTH) protein